MMPRSLFGRLLAIAVVSTLAALLLAGVAIGHVLERFVLHGLDDRLDAQVAMIAGAVRADGTLDGSRVVALPDFADPASGWVWQVDGPHGRRWRNAPGIASLPARPPRHPRQDDRRPSPEDGRGRHGERLHARSLSLETPAGQVTITAAGPRRVVEAPLREAMVPLLASLALLGAGLAAATLIQLRIGLRPLRALERSIADVTASRREHVPETQPLELAPLAAAMNALIDRNAAGLAHARGHVANLAHGLKTPLATLALRLAEPGRDPDGALSAMVGAIDRRVSHHLRRARAAAPSGGGVAATALRPAIDDLIAALARIHATRGIAIAVIAPDAIAVAVDPQDLDEMIGNLLDNAWRHARTAIRVTAAADRGFAGIAIEDDGAGLDDAAIAEALMPGRRLDEREPGHGFGLPITRELAELNGGTLTLSRSADLGGLSAVLHLPRTGVR